MSRVQGLFRVRRSQSLLLSALLISGCAGQQEGSSIWDELLVGERSFPSVYPGATPNSSDWQNDDPRKSAASIVYGSDRSVGGANTQSRHGAIAVDDGVLLNFEKAPLRDTIDTILGSILELNYIYDPRVTGEVTIRTVAPLNRNDALAAVETVLRQNGGALIQVGEVLSIVPIAEAGAGVRMPALAGGEISTRPGYGILVAPLRNASATELAETLQPVVGPQTTIQSDAARNALIISGSNAELSSLRETIEMFDVDWLDGLSVGLIPLENANPEAVINELGTVMGGESSPLLNQVQLQPVARLNAVLIVARTRKILDDLRAWTSRLDRATETVETDFFVYPVENARAKDIAKVLSEVMSGGGANSAELFNAGLGLAADADPVTVSAGGAPVYATAAFKIGERDVRIAANDTNNSLLIRATRSDYEKLEAIIRKLDTVPLQILLEATIAEVTLNNQLDYGVQFFLESGNLAFSNSSSISRSVDPTLPGLAASFLAGNNKVILSAIDSVTNLNVISSPRILALDNQSARLQVGDEVPVITQQQQSTDAFSNIVNTVEFRETGVTLEIKPRVNSSGLITLDILQETSNVVEESANGTLTPTISQRTIESSIAVQDGNTILLGGMIQERNASNKSGVPLLSDLPGIGPLFGTRGNGRNRTELIILLTPRVIRNPEDLRSVSEEMRQRLQDMRPQLYPTSELSGPVALTSGLRRSVRQLRPPAAPSAPTTGPISSGAPMPLYFQQGPAGLPEAPQPAPEPVTSAPARYNAIGSLQSEIAAPTIEPPFELPARRQSWSSKVYVPASASQIASYAAVAYSDWDLTIITVE